MGLRAGVIGMFAAQGPRCFNANEIPYMSRSIRVAALQLSAHDRADFLRTWPGVLGRIDEAASETDLLVLPECTIPAYVLGRAALDDRRIAEAVASLRALAKERRCVIVAGVAMQGTNGNLYNRALAIDRDGSDAGCADKIFLWDFDRMWFSPGERIAPVKTSLGQLGLLICADGRMPEISATLVERGAELLVMPTAWVTSGRDAANLENAQADILGRVRAYENGVAFVAANKCGTERGIVAYCGKSQIVDAEGSVLALASQDCEEVLRATIHLEPAKPHRSTHVESKVASAVESPVENARIAVTIDPITPELRAEFALLDAQALDCIADAIVLDDDTLLDPRTLVEPRLAGCRLAIWRVHRASSWTQRIACARALELRIYVAVLDYADDRAYAIDPDGHLVAGTFGAFRTASFWFDATRTRRTLLAPETDILEGLARVHALLDKQLA